MKALLFLLILVLFCVGTCEGSTTNVLVPYYINLLFLSACLFVATAIRQVLYRFHIYIPYDVFLIVLSCLWGALLLYEKSIDEFSMARYMVPQEILFVFAPLAVFNILFCVDGTIFMKSLPQLAAISCPVALLTGVLHGIFIRMVVDPKWDIPMGILFGVMCNVSHPSSIIYLLKKQSIRTKQISMLVEGEAVCSMIVIQIVHTLVLNHRLGFVVRWYQFLALIARFIIMGILFGYLMGLLGRSLFRRMSTNYLSIFVLSFGMPLCTYAISKVYVSGCGTIAVAVMAVMLSFERSSMSADFDRFLGGFCEVSSFVLDVAFCVICSLLAVTEYSGYFDWALPLRAFTNYCVYYAVRFFSFLVFSPVLSRVGYGMDARNMLMCVWSGVKNPFMLVVVQNFINNRIRFSDRYDFYLQLMALYFLSKLINGSLMSTIMDFLELRKISGAKQMNMDYCLRHILKKRERTVAVLKMDRFLADANWPLVIGATNMRHPYHLEMQKGAEEDYFYTYEDYSECPDCKHEIHFQPSNREFKEMTREGKMRILKMKKMTYSRQFENGMISKEGIRTLIYSIELAMDSESAIIELDYLEKRFTQEGFFARFIRHRVLDLKKSKHHHLRPPRRYVRRVCYSVVVNHTWERVLLVVVALHVVMLVCILLYHLYWSSSPGGSVVVHSVVAGLSFLFGCIYTLEAVMKILAYSFVKITGGLGIYFKSFWNIMDFLIITPVFLYAVIVATMPQVEEGGQETLEVVVYYLQYLRAIRLFKIFEIFYPKVIRYLEKIVDSNLAFTYELGKSYATAETEILDMLPYVIENKKIREEIKKRVEKDRVAITKLLGIVQKEKSWVAITVKTKQAIRTILKSMSEAIADLKSSGWIDAYEQEKLEGAMRHLYKKVNSVKSVQQSAPKVIFKEVAWMAGDEAIIDFLFKHIRVKTFEPGQVVFGDQDVADGVYIVVTGLLMITYTPNDDILYRLQELGQLPVVDYLAGTKLKESNVDYIVSGNSVGELSCMTNRYYDCIVTSDAHSQVYVVDRLVLNQAMKMSPSRINGLACRIWKDISIRIAVPLLLSVPAYQNFSQDQIKYTLERAFTPDLSNFKVFSITDVIQDIVLLEGVVADYNTRETFVAPFCLPRTVQKLIMPQSSLMNLPSTVEVKLLIIPGKDLNEYDVMAVAAETGDLVSTDSMAECVEFANQRRSRRGNVQKSQRKQNESVEESVSGSFAGDEDEKEKRILEYYAQPRRTLLL